MKDNDTVLDRGPGKIVMLPHFIDHAPESLKELLESDPSVAKFVSSLTVANGNGRDDRGFESESSDEPVGEGKEVLA